MALEEEGHIKTEKRDYHLRKKEMIHTGQRYYILWHYSYTDNMFLSVFSLNMGSEKKGSHHSWGYNHSYDMDAVVLCEI